MGKVELISAIALAKAKREADKEWVNQRKIDKVNATLQKAKAMLEAAKAGNYIDPRGYVPTVSSIDIEPCKSCGRVVYTGRCCNG